MTTEAVPKRPPSRRGRWLLWGADAALVGLLAAANAAPFVPPEQLWGLQVVAIFGTLVLVAAALVAVGLIVKRRWALAALHLLLCLATVLMPELNASADPATAAADAPGLTVMTFNAGKDGGGKQHVLANVLARDRPHLIALQEFSIRLLRDTGVTWGAPLLGPLLKDKAYEMSRPDGGKDFMFSRPLFSRIEAVGRSELVRGNPPEGLWSSGGITRRAYRWQGRTIMVYNVHLHSFSSQRPWRREDQRFSPRAWLDAFHAYGRDFEVRAEQARQLRAMLDAEPHPFLVCGDFNSTPRNWAYTHLAHGFRDAFDEAGTGWGGTFPAGLPLVRIDYVLASDDWVVRRARVDPDLVSDHRAVIAELVLKPSAQAARRPSEP